MSNRYCVWLLEVGCGWCSEDCCSLMEKQKKQNSKATVNKMLKLVSLGKIHSIHQIENHFVLQTAWQKRGRQKWRLWKSLPTEWPMRAVCDGRVMLKWQSVKTEKKKRSLCRWVWVCVSVCASWCQGWGRKDPRAGRHANPPLPLPTLSALIRWGFLLRCARSSARDKDRLTDVPLISGPTSSPSTP